MEIRDFLQTARRKDAASVKIMQKKNLTKFKIRCSRVGAGGESLSAVFLCAASPIVVAPLWYAIRVQYLYTLTVKDAEKAKKLRQSLPPGKLVFTLPCTAPVSNALVLV